MMSVTDVGVKWSTLCTCTKWKPW